MKTRFYFLLAILIFILGAVLIYIFSNNNKQKAVASLRPKKGFAIQHIPINKTIKKIEVFKKKRIMKVFFKDTFKLYRVALGYQPVGHKKQEGDRKTPEGSYVICIKNPHSLGHKSLKISYPGPKDRQQALARGVSPGGDVCIHGLFGKGMDPETHWESDWTWGCVAVNNTEIDEIYKWCNVGTPVKIYP